MRLMDVVADQEVDESPKNHDREAEHAKSKAAGTLRRNDKDFTLDKHT